MSALVAKIYKPDQSITQASVSARVRLAAQSTVAPSTVQVYETWWRSFEKWVESDNAMRPASARRSSMPAHPSAVLDFLAERKTKSSYRVAAAAIRYMHVSQGYRPPLEKHADEARAVFAGFSRLVAARPNRAPAITIDEFTRLVDSFDCSSRHDLRAKIFCILSFFGAFRRSEAISLLRCDIREVPQGLVIFLRRTKTSQLGDGEEVALARRDDAYCPVRAYRLWSRFLDIYHNGEVYFFPGRSSGKPASETQLRERILTQLKKIGLAESKLSMHSFRAGFATAAFESGATELEIREVTRHRSITQLAAYYRPRDPFTRHAARKITIAKTS